MIANHYFRWLWISLSIGIASSLIGNYFLEQTHFTIFPNWKLIWISTTAIFLSVNLMYAFNIFSKTSKKDLRKPTQDKLNAMSSLIGQKYLGKLPNGFTIGKVGKRYFNIIPDKKNILNQIYYGGPGSGKSAIILNYLLHRNLSNIPDIVFVIDLKGELLRKSTLKKQDDIRVINPISSGGCGYDVWFGLDRATVSSDDLLERADIVAKALVPIPAGGEKNAYFYHNSWKILKAFLAYFYLIDKDFSESITEILSTPMKDLITTVLMDDRMDSHPKIPALLQSFEGKDKNESIQDIETTMKENLDIFLNDEVYNKFSSQGTKTSPLDLLGGKSQFLYVPDDKVEQLTPITRLIVSLTIKALFAVPEPEREKGPIITLILDEFAALQNMSDVIMPALSRLRSRLVSVILLYQSQNQLNYIYGKEQAEAIRQNCEVITILGTKDVQSAKEIVDWAGTYTETKVSQNKRNRIFDGIQSKTLSEDRRNVLEVSDVIRLRQNNQAIVLIEGEVVLLEKLPYFKIKQYLDKSKEIVLQNDLFDKNQKEGDKSEGTEKKTKTA